MSGLSRTAANQPFAKGKPVKQIVGPQPQESVRDKGAAIHSTPPHRILTFQASHKLIAGSIAGAVLFGYFEQCFRDSAPTTSVLTAPIDHWRIDGFLSVKEFYYALQPFGYRYYSRIKFEAARSAQREWIHPTRSEWLLYILVHDQRTQTDRLIRNGALITAKLTGYKPDLQAVIAEAAKMTAKAEVRRIRERFL